MYIYDSSQVGTNIRYGKEFCIHMAIKLYKELEVRLPNSTTNPMHLIDTCTKQPPTTPKAPPSQLGPRSPPGLLVLVPQQTPQNLPTRTLRNHLNELHTTLQPLVPCLVLFHMLLNLALDHAVVVFEPYRRSLDDVSFGDFPCCIVGNRDDGDVGNGRMCEEMGFELGRGDLQTLDEFRDTIRGLKLRLLP